MDDWFRSIADSTSLSAEAANALQVDGFTVMSGQTSGADLAELAAGYDRAVTEALPEDVRAGSTTTRISDFVNRGAGFDDLYLHPSILQACCVIIGQPFKLSTMLARTLRPRMPAQRLHVDFASDTQGWPMVGFIYMIDEFTAENGATCFTPGSQGKAEMPVNANLVPACGPAGSVIIFNGSAWHGHGANRTDTPRRSIQGAYIRRSEISGANLPDRMLPETLGRLSPLAKYLIAI